jgi:hypothetical protein
VSAERDVAVGLAAVHADARFPPLPLLVDERHQRHRHVEYAGGELGNAVERRLVRRVEHLVARQRPQAVGLIFG